MVSYPMPLCEACAHLLPFPGEDGTGYTCTAYPTGIPEEINPQGADHRQPWPGDGGVQFVLSPGPGAAARLASYEARLAMAATEVEEEEAPAP